MAADILYHILAPGLDAKHVKVNNPATLRSSYQLQCFCKAHYQKTFLYKVFSHLKQNAS